LTAASPLAKWAWREAELPNLDVWSYAEIPLDLDGAVTMTATIAATLPQEEGGTERSVWIDRHERTLGWRIEDSLDGERWFTVASGAATRTQPAQVTRISSPLGTTARLAWWANCVIASIRRDSGETQERAPASRRDPRGPSEGSRGRARSTTRHWSSQMPPSTSPSGLSSVRRLAAGRSRGARAGLPPGAQPGSVAPRRPAPGDRRPARRRPRPPAAGATGWPSSSWPGG
jgi:hypothetical protein